jgi:hypothetical protein
VVLWEVVVVGGAVEGRVNLTCVVVRFDAYFMVEDSETVPRIVINAMQMQNDIMLFNIFLALSLPSIVSSFNPNRPRNPHKASDIECRAKHMFARSNPKARDHEAEYELDEIIPGSIDGCHTLWLSDFELWDEGAIAVANALKGNDQVHTVYMHFSQVGDDGAEAFAELLKTNQDLHTINLGHNAIETEGAIHLAEALKVNTGLHTLTLDHNKIKEPGILALIEALKVNEDVLHVSETCGLCVVCGVWCPC